MPANSSHRWLHVLEQHRRYSSDFPCHLTITNNRMRSHIVGLSNECARCGIISNPQAHSISHRQLYTFPQEPLANSFIYMQAPVELFAMTFWTIQRCQICFPRAITHQAIWLHCQIEGYDTQTQAVSRNIQYIIHTHVYRLWYTSCTCITYFYRRIRHAKLRGYIIRYCLDHCGPTSLYGTGRGTCTLLVLVRIASVYGSPTVYMSAQHKQSDPQHGFIQ